MAEDAEVKFGANIEKATEALNQIKEKLDGLKETALHLAEAFGIAFSVEAVKQFVESMAELGLATEKIAAQLGLSNQQTVELSGMAKLAGADVNRLAFGMERLYLSLQRSTRDGVNPAAQALKVLHLQASDLIGLPADQFFEKLTTQIAKFNPSMNLSTALMQIGAREMARLVGPLSIIGKHYEEFKEKVRAASEGLAGAVPGMAETHEKITLLGISMQSLGARIFTVLKPAIDWVVERLTVWVQSLNTEKIIGYVSTIGAATIDIGLSVAKFFVGLQLLIESFLIKAESVIAPLKTMAGYANTLAYYLLPGGAAMTLLKKSLESGTVSDAFAEAAKKAEGRMKALEDQAKALQEKLDKGLENVRKTLGGGEDKPAGGLDADKINERAQAAIKAAQQTAQQIIKLNDVAYRDEAEQINVAAKLFQLTEDQKSQALLAAVAKRDEIHIGALQKEASDLRRLGANPEMVKKIEDEITLIKAKAVGERRKITDAALEADVHQWQSALGAIQSAWDSQLRALLGRTETWSQAMKKIVADLVINVIQFFEKIAVEKAALGLANMFGGGPQSMVMSLISPGTAANTTALTALTASVNGLIIAMGGSAISTDVNTAAQETSMAATIAQTIATNLNTVAQFVKGMLGFSSGAWSVPRDMTAAIHKDEMIVPAEGGVADVMRSMLGGIGKAGGVGAGHSSTMHLNVSAFNPSGMQQAIKQMMPQLAREMRAHIKMNPSTQ